MCVYLCISIFAYAKIVGMKAQNIAHKFAAEFHLFFFLILSFFIASFLYLSFAALSGDPY